jgi:hypothetical protein
MANRFPAPKGMVYQLQICNHSLLSAAYVLARLWDEQANAPFLPVILNA